MAEVFIRPREGLMVRDPSSKQAIPDSGTVVSLSGKDGTYWRRRIGCGDVIVVPAAKSSPKKK